jgi:hypothetical protein
VEISLGRGFKSKLLMMLGLLSACTSPVVPQDEGDSLRGRAFGFKTYAGFVYSTLEGVGGKRLNLILNTGAHSTILTEDALAACPQARYLQNLTVTFPFGNIAGKEYSVSGLMWEGVPLGALTVFVLDRDHHKLLLDSHLDGFLGFPLFQGRAVQFHWSRRTVTFLRSYDESDYDGKAEFTYNDHHPRLRGTIQGEPVDLETSAKPLK